MYTACQIVSPPAIPLISVGLLRRHTRISQTADDDLLALYVDSATQQAQNYLNRSLLTQTIRYHYAPTQPPAQWPMASVPFAVFPLGLEWVLNHSGMSNLDLIRSPVQSIVGVGNGIWGQSDTTLVAGTDYDVDLGIDPARIHMYGTQNQSGQTHGSITYVAGYGDRPEQVPAPIRHAVMLMSAMYVESRGDVAFELPIAAKRLLDDYRVPVFGSGF